MVWSYKGLTQKSGKPLIEKTKPVVNKTGTFKDMAGKNGLKGLNGMPLITKDKPVRGGINPLKRGGGSKKDLRARAKNNK